MNTGSKEMVYEYFQRPNCHRDFPGTNFFIENIPIKTSETIEENTFWNITWVLLKILEKLGTR